MHSARNSPVDPRSASSCASIASSALASVARLSSFSRFSFSASSVARVGIAGQKQIDDIAGDVHPSGGIDARRQPKPDLRCRGCAIRRNLSYLHQGSQARLDGVPQLAQSESRNHPVLPLQRHRVRNGRNRYELEERGKQPSPSADALSASVSAAAERMAWASLKATPAPHSDLNGYGHPSCAGLMHSHGLRDPYNVIGKMVVGNDQVQP